MDKKNQKYVYIAGFAAIAVMVIVALALGNMNGAEFGGADDAGGNVIKEVSPGFTGPWWSGIFGDYEIPGETESMLFALQAAIGAIIIGFFIGYVYRGKRDERIVKSAESREE